MSRKQKMRAVEKVASCDPIWSALRAQASNKAFWLGLAGTSLLVALYALGGKIVPGLHLAFFDLNPGDEFVYFETTNSRAPNCESTDSKGADC